MTREFKESCCKRYPDELVACHEAPAPIGLKAQPPVAGVTCQRVEAITKH